MELPETVARNPSSTFVSTPRRLVYTAFSAGPATLRAEHAIIIDKSLFEGAAREAARAAVKSRRAAADSWPRRRSRRYPTPRRRSCVGNIKSGAAATHRRNDLVGGLLASHCIIAPSARGRPRSAFISARANRTQNAGGISGARDIRHRVSQTCRRLKN